MPWRPERRMFAVPPPAALRRVTLHLVTAPRLDVLADRLLERLATAPLADPFAAETIVVQSSGMRRWITKEMARQQGCAASLDLPFPATFAQRLAGTVLALPRAEDPFERDALTWRVFTLLADEKLLAGEAFAPVRGYLAAAKGDRRADVRKRFGLAQRIAQAFDDYQLYRPGLVLGWEEGTSGTRSLAGSETGDLHEGWQLALWRRIVADVATDDGPPMHLARRFDSAIEKLNGDATPSGLPTRLAVFGVSSLPSTFVSLLVALGRHVPVDVYVVAPPNVHDRDTEHPLVRQQGAQLNALLGLFVEKGIVPEPLATASVPSTTALGVLQGEILAGVDRSPGAPVRLPPSKFRLGPDDPSLRVHVCHSPMRELEVLRDQLLAAFDAPDADGRGPLRPHEVLVMLPDVATYAPYVRAVFDSREEGLPSIPFQIADRPPASTWSLSRGALALLDLVESRRATSEVLALLDVPAIRDAAGIDEADLETVHRLVQEAGVRWGTDAAHRARRFDFPPYDATTWRAGIRRLVAGHALGAVEGVVVDTVPAAGATAGDLALLGRFLDWADRLHAQLDALEDDRPLVDWIAATDALLESMLRPQDQEERQALGTLRAGLRALRTQVEVAEIDVAVPLSVFRDRVAFDLSDERAGTGFLDGGVTFCAYKPMRVVPHRVVAMLGLDVKGFPRRDHAAPFDLRAALHHAGDRSLREDDRQLFLDTILSAGERLHLSYVGRSLKDNEERPPSVVVDELLDVVDRTFAATMEGKRARDEVVVHHPLQPFSPVYFDGSDPRLFGYSAAYARQGAAAGGGATLPRFVEGPITVAASSPYAIDLEQLVRCWQNPSRWFCSRSLQLAFQGVEDDTPEDTELVALAGLDRWSAADWVLERERRGALPVDGDRILEARGALPFDHLGRAAWSTLSGQMRGLVEAANVGALQPPARVEVRGNDWLLTGRIDLLHERGVLVIRPGSVRPRDRVRAWILHLVRCATVPPERLAEVCTVLVGEDAKREPVVERLRPVTDAKAHLESLVRGARDGLSLPLPFYEKASWALVDGGMDDATLAFEGAGASSWNSCDLDDEYVALCTVGSSPLTERLDEFDRWAKAIWTPYRDHLEGSLADAGEDEEDDE